MKNGETLYKKLKLGEVDKSQLTEQQKGDLYQYMVDSKKVTVNMIKPEVAQKYNLSVTPTPSRSPDTNAPIITPTYTPTHIPSRSPDTNAINYQPPKSTTPEMELVDILSNITMPTRGRTTQHERQQGSAYTPKSITQSTPTDLTLANRIEGGIKGIGYNWLGGILGASGTASEFLGTGEEITLGEGMKTEKGFDLSSQLQPSAKDLMKTSDELLYKGQQHTAKGREGLGTAGGVAYDILTGAGQMGADIGTAALTGVGMLPVLGTRVFGQGASEARQSGADINQQIAYGAISAGIEIATEKLVGGLPMAEKLGMGGVADNTIKKLAQGISSSPRLAKAFTYLANMAGEGAEEMIAEILNPIAKKLTYDQNADWATIEEVLYSGLLGAGISGVMGGGVLLQGNNQTPTETPTKTQSVMTNENIEPDIQGFQSTIDTGLNQLYSVLDSGQKNEQAINTMITNLEKVKKLMPILSEYVDGHIERLSNYKVIEQPQTNEIEEVEQIINDDVSVPQTEDKSVTEDIKEIDTQIDDSVAEIDTPTIDKLIDNYIGDGKYLENELKHNSFDDVINTHAKDFLATYSNQITDDTETLDIVRDKLSNKLQDSNNIVAETKQKDNVINVTEEEAKEKAREKQKQEFNNRREEAQSKLTVPDWVEDIELELPSTEYENTEWGVSKKQTTKTINARDYYLEMLQNNWQLLENPKLKSNTIKDIERYVKELISKHATVQPTKQPTTNETIPTEQIVEEDTKDVKIGSKESKITSKKYKSSKSKDSTPYQVVLENDEIKIYYFDGRKKYGYFPLNYKEYLKQETTYDRRKFIDREMTNYLLERDGKAFNYKLNEKGMEILKLYGFETDAEPVQKALDEVLKEAELYQQTLAEAMEERRTKREQEQSKQKEIKTDVAENETTETQDNKEPLNLNNYTFQYKDELTIDYDKVRKATVAGGLEAHAYSLPSSDTIRVVIEGESSVHPKTIYKKNILTVNGRPSNWQETTTETAKTENAQIEININNFMDSVNENDIDFKKAESAYRAVSFDPDKRAKSIQKDYVNTVKRVYDELLPLAKTEEQKTVLLEEMQKFKENYLKKQNAVLDATSRTMSSMITGPANFPVARNQKALDTEHKRMVEFSEWYNKAIPSIKKKIEGIKPEIDKFNDNVKEIKDRANRTIKTLVDIKNGSPYDPALIRSNLKSYLERKLSSGYIKEVEQVADYIKEQQKEKGITVFSSINNIWKQIENAKPKQVETGESTFKEYKGARIVENKDIDRVQLFFDEKPSNEVRTELKKSGWHYSKTNNDAWQRKITGNALFSAEQIIDKFFKRQEISETKTTKKEEIVSEKLYRYYLTQRPPSPGAIPRGSKNTVSFDTKQEVDGLEAWGYVEYDKPLTEKQISDYELTEKSKAETIEQPKKVTIRERVPSNELSTTELVQRVKAMGKDAQSSYGLFVKERDLKPEIDSKEFNEIFNRVSQNEHIKTKTVDFAPTHKYLGKDVMITDIGSKYEFLSENGSTGTEFKPLRKEFTPIQESENVTETKQLTETEEQSTKETVTEETEKVTETQEEQIEETKEELQERVEKMRETGTSSLKANEAKMYNFLIANKDVDVYELMDNRLEIPRSNADGFDSQQRYAFVKKLIEAAIKEDTFNTIQEQAVKDEKGNITKDSKGNVIKAQGLKNVTADVITIDIPRDGTFRIAPDYGSVSVVLNRLGVKVKSQIPKGFKKVFGKGMITTGDDYYSDGIIAVKADKVVLEEIKGTYENVKSMGTEYKTMDKLFNKVFTNPKWQEIKDSPYLTLNKISSTIDKSYFFVVDGKAYLYQQKYVDFLNKDGNRFYVDTNSIGAVKVENANNEIIGVIIPVKHDKNNIPDFTDGNTYQTTKQNFFSKAKETKSKGYKGEEGFKGKSNKQLIDMSRKLKKPTEIRKDITKKFNIPTSTKKFNRSKKFLGYYKIMPEVIRLRYDNDIGAVMHELGHHFDKKYGFNSLNKQLITDMVNKMNPAFKKNYQKSELPGEAMAEFLRYYTTAPTTAEEFAGDFYDLFEQTLSKDDLKNIQEIRNDVLRWVNAERAEKRQSTIVPLSQKKKVSERISETIKFEKANSVLFDRYAPIQEFVKTVEKLTGRKLPASLNPYMLVERTYKNNATIEGLIKGQLRDTEFKALDTDDSLQKIVDDVKRDVTPFEDYLKLKHAITLAEKNHMIYSPDVYNNIDDMQQDLEFTEQQYPQFIELSERLYDWYDKFFKAWVVDTNMLGEDSKKIYTKMRQEYPYYVPMFRVREDGSSKQASSSLTDQKAPVDRLSEKGSDRDTISPIDNIITQVSRMVNAYSKNNVMRAIVENYNTVDGLGGFIDRVPPDMEKQILSTQSIKDSLETEFEDVENIDELINSIPDLIENYKPLTKSRDKEIVGVITKSGKRQFYQVFDKAFLNSLTNMNPTQLDATVRMIASVRRTTTALTTGLNPIFGIASNAPRDFLQAYVFGSYKNPAEYVYQYAKVLTGVVKKNDNYKTFRDIGGVYGSSMTTELRTKNDFIRRLTKYRKGQKVGAKNALSYIGELILDFNDAIETAPRLAEFNKAYKIAKKRGDSDYDATLYALHRADDVTLNFSRRGEIMNTAIGQSIPYFNAGLQGMDKLRRGLFTGEERTQTLIKSITMLTIPTILLWLAHRDDEDYEKLTKGIKDNYWILWKNPDGSFVRIPKPKDLAGIFSADFERALNSYFKEEGAGAFEGFQSTIADSLLPPVDTIFRPLIDVASNEKWSGGKIIPMAMEYLPKTEQYDETTSKIAVELAQLIGKVTPGSNFASPKNVDYILDQYYGGLADVLLPIATPTSYVDVDTLRDKYNYLARPMAAIMQVGETINRKFKADPSYSNDVVNDFYDLRDKTTKANNAYEKRGVMSNDVDLISENQFKAYYKSISSMWKTIDYIDSLANKPLPDEYKEGFKKLINQSRFADSEKQKVINDMKDGKLNRESVTMLQKTVRDEIVKLADKAVKEYKANHKENNEILR